VASSLIPARRACRRLFSAPASAAIIMGGTVA
jgi:hypothetical protein